MRSRFTFVFGACALVALWPRHAAAIQVILAAASGSVSVSKVIDDGVLTGGTLDLVEYATPLLPASETVEALDGGWIANDAGSNALAKYELFGKVGTIRSAVAAECEADAALPGQPSLFNSARATAEAYVSWGDDMIVTSPTGGPVLMAARVIVHADCGLTEGTTASTTNFLRYSYRLPGIAQTQVTELLDVQGDYLFDETFVLSVDPGAYFIANGLRLEVAAEARVNDGNPAWKAEAFSRIDAMHTMSITFDVISGGDYVMASGADLRSVPTPGAALIILIAAPTVTRRIRGHEHDFKRPSN